MSLPLSPVATFDKAMFVPPTFMYPWPPKAAEFLVALMIPPVSLVFPYSSIFTYSLEVNF